MRLNEPSSRVSGCQCRIAGHVGIDPRLILGGVIRFGPVGVNCFNCMVGLPRRSSDRAMGTRIPAWTATRSCVL